MPCEEKNYIVWTINNFDVLIRPDVILIRSDDILIRLDKLMYTIGTNKRVLPSILCTGELELNVSPD